MNILLLGRTGQIGDALLAHPPAWARLAALDRRQADLRDLGRLAAVLDAYAPRILINAAAYTEVDRAEAEPELALRINAQAVAVMADYARRNNALLVHYSTDYVFDGKRARAYRETDAAHPLNAYGRSKLAGEQAIAASGCPHLILRTSWVYASHGANFVKTILRLARTRAELSVVADQHGAPIWAGRIAAVTWQAIDAHRRRRLPDGLWHLSAGGHVSWHGLACHIVARARRAGLALSLTRRTSGPSRRRNTRCRRHGRPIRGWTAARYAMPWSPSCPTGKSTWMRSWMPWPRGRIPCSAAPGARITVNPPGKNSEAS